MCFSKFSFLPCLKTQDTSTWSTNLCPGNFFQGIERCNPWELHSWAVKDCNASLWQRTTGILFQLNTGSIQSYPLGMKPPQSAEDCASSWQQDMEEDADYSLAQSPHSTTSLLSPSSQHPRRHSFNPCHSKNDSSEFWYNIGLTADQRIFY